MRLVHAWIVEGEIEYAWYEDFVEDRPVFWATNRVGEVLYEDELKLQVL